MKTTWLAIACGAIVGNLLACGGGAEGPDPGTGADGGGGGGKADGSGDAACPASEPICSAFVNSGSAGGHVEVSLAEDGAAAIVSTNSLPDYPATDFGDNPNEALPQDLEFRVPLAPSAGPSEAGLGHVGVAWNGVSLFNPSDARDIGGCTGNAAYLESDGMDDYGGHPTGRGEYHYHTGDFVEHAAELGLVNQPGTHSSLVGYAFDGVPIYGPYGSAADGSIAELRSCYRLKEERTCCVDGPRCSTDSLFAGKLLSMGAFVEDFEFDQPAFDAGECDLDEFNSRVAATPEYPSPVRVYVMTFDDEGHAAFPFIFGTRYWGAAPDQP
jgi:hypothetical protein